MDNQPKTKHVYRSIT